MPKDSGINKKSEPARIGVHCVAGLGRAPLLVALGLVYGGMEPCNAVDLIKKQRPGAINWAQAEFILAFKPPKPAQEGSNSTCGCSIF